MIRPKRLNDFRFRLFQSNDVRFRLFESNDVRFRLCSTLLDIVLLCPTIPDIVRLCSTLPGIVRICSNFIGNFSPIPGINRSVLNYNETRTSFDIMLSSSVILVLTFFVVFYPRPLLLVFLRWVLLLVFVYV